MVKLSAKCIVAGDSSVGKSALIQLFRNNGSHFLKSYTMMCSACFKIISDVIDFMKAPLLLSFHVNFAYLCHILMAWPAADLITRLLQTTSMDVVMKTVLIPDTGDSVELFLCDTPGKAMFYDMTEMLWDQPGVLCVVFDITNEISFSNCIKWLQKVKTKTSSPHVPGVLVGNKTDLSACRTVTKTEAQELAMKHGLEYFETSVKELENFEQPFQALAKAFYHLYHERVENFKSLV